jgi:glycosyltransferase involved in cell wall biosynthesis
MVKKRSLFVDCTHTYLFGGNTGVQRTVRSLVGEMKRHESLGLEIVPVCFSGFSFVRVDLFTNKESRFKKITIFLKKHFPTFYSALFSVNYFLLSLRLILKPKINFSKNDIFLSLYQNPNIRFWKYISKKRTDGLKVVSFVHDIIPFTHPQFFEKVDVVRFSKVFKEVLKNSDFYITNSASTKKSLEEFGLDKNKIEVNYLGSDISLNHHEVIRNPQSDIASLKPYIVVSTIEPRKNHQYILKEFEKLWRDGFTGKLCFIGKMGWVPDSFCKYLLNHKELNKKLFILNDVNDAELQLFYKTTSGLITASHIEGLNLPLIEALNFGVRVFASDIPVHREVGGNHPLFFNINEDNEKSEGKSKISLSESIMLHQAPKSLSENNTKFIWPTWFASAENMIKKILLFFG